MLAIEALRIRPWCLQSLLIWWGGTVKSRMRSMTSITSAHASNVADGGPSSRVQLQYFPNPASRWTACPVEAVKSCTRRRRTPHHTPTRHSTLHAASDLRPEGADLRPEGALHDSSREGCEDHQQDDHKNDQACASLDAQPTAAFRPPTVTTSQVHRLPGRQSAP